jgi:hypothetical protein
MKKKPVKKATQKYRPKAKAKAAATRRKTPSRAGKLSPQASSRLDFDDILMAYEDMKSDIVDSITDVVSDSFASPQVKSAIRKQQVSTSKAMSEISDQLYEIGADVAHVSDTLDKFVKGNKTASKKQSIINKKKQQEEMADTIAVALAKLSKKKVTRKRVSESVHKAMGLAEVVKEPLDGPPYLPPRRSRQPVASFVQQPRGRKRRRGNEPVGLARLLMGSMTDAEIKREMERTLESSDLAHYTGWKARQALVRLRMARARMSQREANPDELMSLVPNNLKKKDKFGLKPDTQFDNVKVGGGLNVGNILGAGAGAAAILERLKKIPKAIRKIPGAGMLGWLGGNVLLPGAAALTMETRVQKLTPKQIDEFKKLQEKYKKGEGNFQKLFTSGLNTASMGGDFIMDKLRELSASPVSKDTMRAFRNINRRRKGLGPERPYDDLQKPADVPSKAFSYEKIEDHRNSIYNRPSTGMAAKDRPRLPKLKQIQMRDESQNMSIPSGVTEARESLFHHPSTGMAAKDRPRLPKLKSIRMRDESQNMSVPKSVTDQRNSIYNRPSTGMAAKDRPRLPALPYDPVLPPKEAEKIVAELKRVKLTIPNRKRIQELIYLFGELSKVRAKMDATVKNSMMPEMADILLIPMREKEAQIINQILMLSKSKKIKSDNLNGSSDSGDLIGSRGNDLLQPVSYTRSRVAPTVGLPMSQPSFSSFEQYRGGSLYDRNGMTRRSGGALGTYSSGYSGDVGSSSSPSGTSTPVEPYRMPGGPLAGSTVGGMIPAGAAPKTGKQFSHSNTNAQTVMNTLMRGGLTREQAEDMTANFMQESGQGLSTSAVGDRDKGLNSFGIGQWNRDRFGRLQKFAKDKGKPITDIQTQAEFALWELEHTHKKAGDRFKAAKSTDERYSILRDQYEVGIHNRKEFNKGKDVLAKGTYSDVAASSVPLNGSPITASKNNDGKSRVKETQGSNARTRRQPLSSKVRNILEYSAAQNGVQVEVWSGGQAAKGSGGPRTGSTRHDLGNAGDVKLFRNVNGKKVYLDMTNADDQKVMAKFAQDAASAGATGVGAHPAYMGSKSMHIGLGSKMVWGAGESSAGAPDWLKRAVEEGWKKPVDLEKWVADQKARESVVKEIEPPKPSMKNVPIENRTLGSIKRGTFAAPRADEIKPPPAPPKREEPKAPQHPEPVAGAAGMKAVSPVKKPEVPVVGPPAIIPSSFAKATAKAKNQDGAVLPATNSQGLTAPWFVSA